jgi:hypothetical protein
MRGAVTLCRQADYEHARDENSNTSLLLRWRELAAGARKPIVTVAGA